MGKRRTSSVASEKTAMTSYKNGIGQSSEMADEEPDESQETRTRQTRVITTDLKARVEELETEIRTLKDGIDPLVSAFLKNKEFAKSLVSGSCTASLFDPQATGSVCKILYLLTKHVQEYENVEKTKAILTQKLLKTRNLLKYQTKSKNELMKLVKNVARSTALEDILGKLRIIFKLARVTPAAPFKTTKLDEDLNVELEDYTPEFENLAGDLYNATQSDIELNYDTEVMDTLPPSGHFREDGTYAYEVEPVSASVNETVIEYVDEPVNASEYVPVNTPKDEPVIASEGVPVISQGDEPASVFKDEGETVISQEDEPASVFKDEGETVISQGDEPASAFKEELVNANDDEPVNTPEDEPVIAPEEEPANASEDELIDDANGSDTDFSELDDGHDESKSGEPTPAQGTASSSEQIKKPVIANGRICRVCDETFTTSAKWLYHMRSSHPEDRPYACDICPCSFYKRERLRVHKKKVHGEKPYTCEICHAAFVWPSKLKDHVNGHLREQKLNNVDNPEPLKDRSCQYCGKVFMKSSQMVNHIRHKHHDVNRFACQLCDKAFNMKSKLKAHLNNDHPGHKDVICDVCGAAYGRLAELERHMRTHVGELPFVCEECGRKFALKASLRKHAYDHRYSRKEMIPQKERKNATCHVCNKTIRLSWMKDHLRIHSEQKPYQCDKCPMSFKQKHSLVTHNKRHNRVYPCLHCDKKFGYKGELNLHLKQHAPGLLKELSCPVCNRFLGDKDVLEKHMLTHSEPKDVKCDQCDMMFHSMKHYRQHKTRIHRNVKIQCDVCGKLLSSRFGLKNHKRIHTGEKPYVCSVCGAQFRKLDGLNNHIGRLHVNANVKYCCSKCGDQFEHKNQLQEHKKQCGSAIFVIENADESDDADVSDCGNDVKIQIQDQIFYLKST